MIRKIFSILFITLLSTINVNADEGMWLPHLLQTMNEEDMKECGLQLTAEDLYSVNNSSLKDAIVSFGGFCTGEMISSKGLLLTNHHCGYEQIQEQSSVRNDYLKEGFWAMNLEEELPNEGLFVSFLVSIENVTDRVLEELGDVSQSERNNKLRTIFSSIVSDSTEGTDYGTISDITISAGDTTGTATFDPTDDSVYEGNETAVISISSVSGADAA